MSMQPGPHPILSHVRKGATPSDLFRNLVLENVSMAAFQDPAMFIAREIFPTVPADEQVAKYFTFDMNSIAQDKMKIRAPGTEGEEGVWNASLASVVINQFDYKEKLPEELIATGGPAANSETVSAQSVAEVLMINEERRFGTAFWATSIWARDMAGAGSADATHYVFWNNAASTPILDIENEKIQILLAGKRIPNVLAVGAYVLPQLLNHPTIIARLNAGQTPGGPAMAQLNPQQQLAMLAQIFGVERVVVARGVYNTTKEGSNTVVNAFCLDGKSAWLGYVNPRPSILSPASGLRFVARNIAGNDMGIRTWRYWDQPKRSWYIETAVDDVFQLISNKLGTFFPAIVQ